MLALMALRVPIWRRDVRARRAGLLWLIAGDRRWLSLPEGPARSRGFSIYDLSVIPLFLLMGQFATQGGLSQALFQRGRGLRRPLSRRRGAWPRSCWPAPRFGAVCGSSVATAATIGQVALPEMKRHGYDRRLATGDAGRRRHAGHPDPAVGACWSSTRSSPSRTSPSCSPRRWCRGCSPCCGYLRAIALLVPRCARRRPGRAAPVPWRERLRALRGVWPVRADLRRRLRRHLRRRVHADRRRGGRRRCHAASPAWRSGELTLARRAPQRCSATAETTGDDLHDLPRRRHAERRRWR
ncbi:MAG: TRAP transporter permease [Comamonadaceae bacterium]|nr:TRAP transporter permease [Comamonadaceae bacterium]